MVVNKDIADGYSIDKWFPDQTVREKVVYSE